MSSLSQSPTGGWWLQAFETYVKDTKQKLARQVEDLEDVRYVMAVLKEVLLDGLIK